MANRSCWRRHGVKDGLPQPGQVLCVFSSDNGAVGTKQRTLWKWVWDLVFCWHWFGLMRVNGLCGERKLLGLLPAAACGDGLDAVTRYKPSSELTTPTGPAGRRKVNLKWNTGVVLQVSPEKFCTSWCRAGCKCWTRPEPSPAAWCAGVFTGGNH